MSKGDFKIVIGSPVDYEELVAYIVIDGLYVALISMDNGKDDLQVVFFDEPKINSLDYDTFLSALIEAKSSLLNG